MPDLVRWCVSLCFRAVCEQWFKGTCERDNRRGYHKGSAGKAPVLRRLPRVRLNLHGVNPARWRGWQAYFLLSRNNESGGHRPPLQWNQDCRRGLRPRIPRINEFRDRNCLMNRTDSIARIYAEGVMPFSIDSTMSAVPSEKRDAASCENDADPQCQ